MSSISTLVFMYQRALALGYSHQEALNLVARIESVHINEVVTAIAAWGQI